MDGPSEHDFLLARKIVAACAKYLAANRGRVSKADKVGANGVREIVTNLDLELNDLAIHAIREECPHDAVLGEEKKVGQPKHRYWIIDPIDGTRSLLSGRPGAAIVVTLVIGGNPILSIVHDIAAARTFNICNGFIHDEAQRLAPTHPPDRVLLWNPYVREIRLLETVVEALALTDVIEVESTALRALAIAEGRGCALVSLPGSSKVWDSAAALHTISVIGGQYSDFYGTPIHLNPRRPVNIRGAIGSFGISHIEFLRAVRPWLDWPTKVD